MVAFLAIFWVCMEFGVSDSTVYRCLFGKKKWSKRKTCRFLSLPTVFHVVALCFLFCCYFCQSCSPILPQKRGHGFYLLEYSVLVVVPKIVLFQSGCPAEMERQCAFFCVCVCVCTLCFDLT